MSKFFEEFIRNDFLDKEASEGSSVKSALSNMSGSLLEKIAMDIGAISEENDMTLEQKLAEEDEDCCGEPNCEHKEKKEKSENEPEKEEKESSDEEDKEEDKEDEKEEKESSDEGEGEEDKEEDDEEEEKESCGKKCASEEDSEFIKVAYELAEYALNNEGMDVFDYVNEKVANEQIAGFIVENAEKLAHLTDMSTLQVADEIIATLAEKLG